MKFRSFKGSGRQNKAGGDGAGCLAYLADQVISGRTLRDHLKSLIGDDPAAADALAEAGLSCRVADNGAVFLAIPNTHPATQAIFEGSEWDEQLEMCGNPLPAWAFALRELSGAAAYRLRLGQERYTSTLVPLEHFIGADFHA